MFVVKIHCHYWLTAIERLFYSQVTNQVIAILSPLQQQLQYDEMMELK